MTDEYTELFRAGSWHDLVFKGDEENKFWSIKIIKNTHVRKWGPSGTKGKELLTEFNTADEARENAEKLYISKTKSGYMVAKPTLNYETDLCHFVSREDLEEFIYDVYGQSLSIREDMLDDGVPLFRFKPTGQISKQEEDDILDWVMTGEKVYLLTHTLLDDCVRQRLIPAGTYIVEV